MSIYARRSLVRPPKSKAVPGLLMKVGSFVKTASAAPASQPVTFGSSRRLRLRPKALFLWTSGGDVDGTIRTVANGDARACLGISSGTDLAEQYAVATMANTGAGAGGRRNKQTAFMLVDTQGTTVRSEASLASFDVDGFTLNWTTNETGEAQIIHYLAIGGDDVQAKVKGLTTPAGTGNFGTTGVGFVPNLLMTIGPQTTLTMDTGAFNSILRIGAAASSSSRWAASMQSAQGSSSPGWRWHRNDRFLQAVSTTGTASGELDHVSMDADGFSLNQIVGASAFLAVLCLKVPRVAVGTFTKPTGGGPAVGSVSGLPFKPVGCLLVSDQDITRSNASSQTGARMGVSAFTAAGAESSVFSIPDNPGAVSYAYLEKSGKAAVKINNATPVVDAECTAVIGGDGFSLTWNANDAVATEYAYVAFGA